jgi:hypothetical protein
MARRLRSRSGVALAAGCFVLVLAACHPGSPSGGAAAQDEAKPTTTAKPPATATAGDAKEADGKQAAAKEAEAEGVTLTPEQIEKIGLVTEDARAVDYSAQAAGYGVVLSHDPIAQGAAELISAQATVRQSRSALARAQKLAGTPGAVSADVEETAAQKAAVDEAALTLTSERLSSTLGMTPPWKEPDQSPTLRDLASGRIKLLRATFPLGSLAAMPQSLRAARIGPAAPGAGWKLHTIWDAPADPNIPGRSYFALLESSDAGEGERLNVWAPTGAAERGVRIPTAAVVLSDGKYWCFVEKQPGSFVRVEIDPSKPLDDGYFVTVGVVAGEKVATTAVAQLLAKEKGGGAEPD